MKRNGRQPAIMYFFFRERASKEVVKLLLGYIGLIISHHKETQKTPTKTKPKNKINKQTKTITKTKKQQQGGKNPKNANKQTKINRKNQT